MQVTRISRRLTLALLAAALISPVAAFAQDSGKEESDQAFLSRMESELRRIEQWSKNLETTVEQRMGMASPSGNRIGVNRSSMSNPTASDPMNSELRSMRLDLRRMQKQIDKERERMAREFGTRDTTGFDREHWRIVVRRFDNDLREMQRDLRSL